MRVPVAAAARAASRAAIVVLLGLPLSGGCGPGDAGSDAGAEAGAADTMAADTADRPDTAPARPEPPAERPATRTDTIFLEGTPEVTRLDLVRSPSGFEPPFSTYVPEGMVRVFGHPERGMEIRFVAAFGGVRNDEASLGVYFHPAGAAAEEVREAARSVAEAHGASGEARRPGRWTWSRVEYPFGDATDGRLFGTVAVGRHGDHWFRVLLRYPPEYGDGFEPRAELILDEWRWEDVGEALGGDAGG